MKIARIYLRVSTDQQDLTRQADIAQSTRAAGYYIAGVHREKASAVRLRQPTSLLPARRASGHPNRYKNDLTTACTSGAANRSPSPDTRLLSCPRRSLTQTTSLTL